GHAVEQRRRELPLPHRVERRRVEQWDRSEHFRFLHGAVRPDGGLDDDDALDARRLGNRRIHRLDVFHLRRLLDVAADAHRRRGRRRWWWWRWRLGEAADDAADDAAGDAPFDAAHD